MAAVRYLVDDVSRAAEFYSTHLGFEVAEQWGTAFALLQRDGFSLWLSGPESSAARPMPDGAKPEPGGWNRLVLQVENLDELVQRMTAAGAHFRNPVVSGPGGKQTLVEDTEGNVVELFEPR